MGFRDEMKVLFGYARTENDVDLLFRLARRRETSEYDIFRDAAARWNIADIFMERDFKKYLDQLELPHYVRDYVRRASEGESDEEEMNEIVRFILRWWERRKKKKRPQNRDEN